VNSIIVSGEIASLTPLEERPSGTPRRYISLRDEPTTPGGDPITWDACFFGSMVDKTADLQLCDYLLISGKVSRGGAQKRQNIVVAQLQVLGSQQETESQESST